MPVLVACPACGARVRIAETMVDRLAALKCPGCKGTLKGAEAPAGAAFSAAPRGRSKAAAPITELEEVEDVEDLPPVEELDEPDRPARRRGRGRDRDREDDWDDRDEDRGRRRSRRRRGTPAWVWLVVAGALVLLLGGGGVVVWYVLIPKTPYDRISRGMAEAEVEKILGPPTFSVGLRSPLFDTDKIASWNTGDTVITVSYRDGRVVRKEKLDVNSAKFRGGNPGGGNNFGGGMGGGGFGR